VSKAAFVIVLLALAFVVLATAVAVSLTMHREPTRPSCPMYDRSLCV
jgi:hypothetical protein